MSHDRPNILLVFTDQWRADYVSALGNGKCETPNLDRLASCGSLFTRAVTANPVCQPARAALLTGRYPHQVNVTCQNGDLRQDVRTVPRALQDAGYTCASVGKLHYGHSTRLQEGTLDRYLDIQKRYGFDDIRLFTGRELKRRTYCLWDRMLVEAGVLEQALAHGKRIVVNGYNNDAPLEERWPAETWPLPEHLHLDNAVGKHAVDYLDGLDTVKPFYLQVTFSGPHPPYDAPASFLEATPYEERDDFITPDGEPLTDAEKKALWRNRHHYRAAIACIDSWIGRLMEVLERRGLAENTLVAFTSDHGEMLGDHRMYNKQVPYKESSRIPLVIRWPGRSEARRHGGIVELTDLSATMLDAAGLDQEDALDTPGLSFHGRLPGRSLRDIVTGTTDRPVRDYAFSVGRGQWSMVESQRWKFVRWTPDEVAGRPTEQLFDLATDPSELVDRSADPRCRGVLLEHREQMLRIYESTPPCQMLYTDYP